ncbi:hypothetical protein [Streptomyces sp. NPDC059828]|uniref:hypothetical protein n=1 Tax=Streptomyces sp. NPDC059828 TaxID=3346965 RepID=UPI003654565A
MLKSWPLRISALIAAPVIAVGLSTEASAHSGNTWVYLKNSSAPNGHSAAMVHVDDGDIFRVYDNYADGHGVRGYLEELRPEEGGFVRVHDSYNGKGYISYSEFRYDVKPNRQYQIRVCTVDGVEDSTPVKCSIRKDFTE